MYNQTALRKNFVSLFAAGLRARVDHAAHHHKMLFVLVTMPVGFALLVPLVASITVYGVYALAVSEAFVSLYIYLQVVLEDTRAVNQTLEEIYNAHPKYREMLLAEAPTQWADAELALA